jgi:hypothetical protein
VYDVFGSSAGLGHHRSFRKSTRWNIPASLGVRLGFMADVERPLPEGVQSRRRWRRIPTSFRVRFGDKWRRVTGDVSAGGALLLFPRRIKRLRLEIVIQLRNRPGTWIATGEIVGWEMRGRRYAHHVRFVNPGPIAGLGAAVQHALLAGENALETT